ncbi:glutamine--fructose-6-phosphate transaminase [Anseongella ginsenosidimutans]|uniref:Glutamine--fructose-6-phosphate aminotransferase [isomerizing] n=1 Tax=Anseongella ginsenosidimutans TaxID=496056 RepID=A0A4R3KNB9_9SPHI|nr:glutamine--fructose-6-phosphate transaminase (isomerizing) [Anseongella ginsenosidimutans]QEC54030.1 glutamine--fructose-6-phosphate transaminase (isomerizing) [Anseongella ginsenosidimutans]TCS85205.1 glutamine--fructose-6-phosphate transaminase [Anseongella ginsenosidimutans]
MCGIVAYIGDRDAYPILIKGLKRLEYRGYDSAGVALLDGNDLRVYRKKGKVSDLEAHTEGKSKEGKIGIGHTRWATHGAPTDANAHPHTSGDGRLAIIHNGIIENYASLKKELISKGHSFESETDTEVLGHFIEEIRKSNQCSLEEAVRIALKRVVGAYVIVIASKDDPGTLIAARKGSPLVIGVGRDEHFLASDATPIVEYTKKVIYVNDHEIAIIRKDELVLKNLTNEEQTPYIHTLDVELEAIEKGGYDHFMIKEIHEQPNTIRDCLRGRLDVEAGRITLGGIREYAANLNNTDRIVFVACGTSWHAGLVAEYVFEELCRVPVEVEYASEFRYRNPVIREGDVIFAVSQSGETADTLVAIEGAKEKGAIIFGICNVVGSSIPRASHEGVYTHAGPEIGVASTKAFTAQLTVLTLIALKSAHERGTIDDKRFRELLAELYRIPEKVKQALDMDEHIRKIAGKYKDAHSFLFLGRRYGFPVALEGALKLKEISYIHAEGYPAAEMKHGHIALVDENLPSVFIATRDSSYEKIVSNIQEIKARGGKVIAVVSEGDDVIPQMADDVIEVPETDELLMPMVSVIPLQLLSYHIGTMKGYNVDQPRNLAKSVTVE